MDADNRQLKNAAKRGIFQSDAIHATRTKASSARIVTEHPDHSRLLRGRTFANVLLAFVAAGVPGTIARLFPTAVRSTGMAVAYNVAVTLFGGLSPLTVTWMIQEWQSGMIAGGLFDHGGRRLARPGHQHAPVLAVTRARLGGIGIACVGNC